MVEMNADNKDERKAFAQAIAIIAYEMADAMLAEREKE
jgi:hypothetical protein